MMLIALVSCGCSRMPPDTLLPVRSGRRLDSAPFEGVLQLSRAPLRQALETIGH
jgi:hypothetical protein